MAPKRGSRRPNRDAGVRGAWRWSRTAACVLIALASFGFLVAMALRSVPWFAPLVADGLRALIGSEAVTELEEVVADWGDRWKRLSHGDERPRSIQEVEIASPRLEPLPPSSASVPAFRPRDVGPVSPRLAAPEDGTWHAVADPALPEAEPILFTTLLHPDIKRPWAEVFVVALELARARLYAVAGTVEPKATTAEGRRYARTGMIPRQHRERLLAAFNGGFKEEHGHHGMFVGGTTLVPLRPELCTVVGYADGSVRIGTWHVLRGNPAVGEGLDGVEFLRQAAPCMVEQGSLHAGLRDETTRRWGATLEGTTVIRRSAIGLDRTRTVLFFAVSNDTTARAIAEAMHHAGADDVAQLDVNWSYPKFLLFPRDAEGNRFARGLFEGFLFEKRDYVSRPSARDFFYLARR